MPLLGCGPRLGAEAPMSRARGPWFCGPSCCPLMFSRPSSCGWGDAPEGGHKPRLSVAAVSDLTMPP